MGRSVAALLLVAMAGGARADALLTVADVVRFLRAGISEQTILVELQGRGFAEPLDPPREAPPVLVTPQDGQEPTFAASTRTVRVPVSVLDPGGEPVMGLIDRDFRISEDGKRPSTTTCASPRTSRPIGSSSDASWEQGGRPRHGRGGHREPGGVRRSPRVRAAVRG